MDSGQLQIAEPRINESVRYRVDRHSFRPFFLLHIPLLWRHSPAPDTEYTLPQPRPLASHLVSYYIPMRYGIYSNVRPRFIAQYNQTNGSNICVPVVIPSWNISRLTPSIHVLWRGFTLYVTFHRHGARRVFAGNCIGSYQSVINHSERF